ncbi:hypothetical protein EUGRSUZ_G01051 [Eucalyptus grandis]|uniref:Uncharacterized protein n=2 Tax=Eucalyptus grandis TaxID=71139 RepID=A0ACC3K2Q6_EUCGR|nr:hypothetical protein EUGRSUZ_G01051 [Eucalyptus grandis]
MPKTSFSFCPTPCTNPPKCYGPERKLECIAKMSQFFSPLENRFILKFQSSIFSQRAQKPVQKPLISCKADLIRSLEEEEDETPGTSNFYRRTSRSKLG